VLTLEIDQDGWGLLLPPLGHLNLKRLLVAIAAVSRCPPGATLLSEPRLGGVLPSDCDGHWQALDAHERALGEPQGRPRVKICSWDELLAAR